MPDASPPGRLALPPLGERSRAPGAGLFAVPQREDGEPVCSRKNCRAAARWQVLWNNPRVHSPDRRKAWASCPDHRVWFEEYLTERGLWRQTLPLVAGRPMETR